MDVLRTELSRQLGLRRIGAGSSKQVYSISKDKSTAVVMFEKELGGKEAIIEALLELFWSKWLHASGILPSDPEWRIFFYLDEKSIEFCIDSGPERSAEQLANRIEELIQQSTESLPSEPLVYCQTKRAYADMEQWLRHGWPTPESTLLVLNQVQSQMRAMHTMAVVHGDIKTSNILIIDPTNGVGQLCDFALSNKDAFRKPCHEGEDPRWVACKGGTYQLNLKHFQETPLQYGIRNDWLGLVITTMRVITSLLCVGTKDHSFADALHSREKPFWHTNNATMEDFSVLSEFTKQLIKHTTLAGNAHLDKIASMLPQMLLQATPNQSVSSDVPSEGRATDTLVHSSLHSLSKSL